MLAFARSIAAMAWVLTLLVIPRLASGQQNDPPPVKGFLEIAHDPSASAAQKKTIAAVIRFVNAKNADEAYPKVMADDSLILYGGGDESISDLSPLAGFKHLKTLVLYNNEISDLTPLATLTQLQNLRLELNRVTDISPLKNLTNLESLQIDDNQISDLRPITGLTRLRTLWIMSNQVKDITPLTGLVALEDIYLNGNPVTDLTPLTRMSISNLRLSELGIEDISALRELNQNTTGFITLDLSKNRIRDVAPLAHLDRVSYLDLSDNRITDISSLAQSKFNYLDLRNNQITDVSVFTSLTPSTVDLRNNPIKDYKPLVALLRAHPHVSIRADSGFAKALSDSAPVRPELANSPLLGTWRTDPIVTGEFGTLVIGLRFEANGLCHRSLSAAGASAEIAPDQHGTYSIAGTVLTLQWGANEAEKHEMRIMDGQLILGGEGQAMKFKKAK